MVKYIFSKIKNVSNSKQIILYFISYKGLMVIVDHNKTSLESYHYYLYFINYLNYYDRLFSEVEEL